MARSAHSSCVGQTSVIAPAVDAWPYGSWYDHAQMTIPRSFVASNDSCDTGPARKRLDGDTRLLYLTPIAYWKSMLHRCLLGTFLSCGCSSDRCMFWAQMVCWQCCYDARQTNQCRCRNIRRLGRERVERTPGGTACMSDHMAKMESGQLSPALPRRFSLVQLERLRRLMRCRAIVTRNRGRHRITWSSIRTPSSTCIEALYSPTQPIAGCPPSAPAQLLPGA
jgi:hypothetical protein